MLTDALAHFNQVQSSHLKAIDRLMMVSFSSDNMPDIERERDRELAQLMVKATTAALEGAASLVMATAEQM